MMRRLTVLVTLAAFVVASVPGLAAEKGGADAAELIRQAQRAVGQVVRGAQEEPKLPADDADAKPFWNAIKELNQALDRADTGLRLKDETFFSALATARAAVQQAEIAVEMNEVTNTAVREPLGVLGRVVGALDENFSMEASRLEQGGELTAKEREQLAKLKSRQDELQKKLEAVEKQAGKNSDKIKESAKQIAENSKKIQKSGNNVGDFVAAMLAARLISDLLWGWHWWWGPWGIGVRASSMSTWWSGTRGSSTPGTIGISWTTRSASTTSGSTRSTTTRPTSSSPTTTSTAGTSASTTRTSLSSPMTWTSGGTTSTAISAPM